MLTSRVLPGVMEPLLLVAQVLSSLPCHYSHSLRIDQVTVATTTDGLLQLNTMTVNGNPFGLHICQLNTSGVTFQKQVFIKEQGICSAMTEADSVPSSAEYSTSVVKTISWSPLHWILELCIS